jgi:hypothetical protein
VGAAVGHSYIVLLFVNVVKDVHVEP